ncbi:MAG: hypothetical protein H6R10_71 [Rhodocyclaceae bacterium]|nr:hypothetical protein [Rhodocyclaceae bacterium]
MPQRDHEITLLRKELELLMGERQLLLQVAGASAALIAGLDSQRLPVGAVEAADVVATSINLLPEETLRDALNSIHAHVEIEEKPRAVNGRA